jgi:plastocyanin
MDTPMTTSRSFSRQPLAALGKLAVTTLIALAALMSYVEVVIFNLAPSGFAFIAIPLVLAGMIAMGWRWAPLLGAIWCGLMLVMNIQFIVHDLTHPEQFAMFVLEVGLDLAMIGGVVGGIAATVQNYRSPLSERRTPAWLPYGLTAMAALSVGALLVAAVVQGRDSTGVSQETLAALPALSAKAAKFEQSELHAKVGEIAALRLENADVEGHSLDVDEFNVHAPMPSGKPGLALFKPTKSGTYSFYCALHYDKASGQGMKGTLIVTP